MCLGEGAGGAKLGEFGIWGGERESKGCIGLTETTRPPGEAMSREAVQGFTPEANERSGLEGRY